MCMFYVGFVQKKHSYYWILGGFWADFGRIFINQWLCPYSSLNTSRMSGTVWYVSGMIATQYQRVVAVPETL